MDTEYILSGEVWNKLHGMGVIGDDYPINEARVLVVQNDYVYLEVKLAISRQQLIELIQLPSES